MSQQDNQQVSVKRFPLRSVLLIALIIGLGAGSTAYVLANAYAANTSKSQSTQTNGSGQQWLGFGRDPQTWRCSQNCSFLIFRGISTANNVTITGFSIVDSTHLTVNLAYHGTGSAPAVTVVVFAPGLSGSNTLSAAWNTPTIVSVSLTGPGALSSTVRVQVLVVPFTGP